MENPELKEQQLDAWLALTRPGSSSDETVRLPVLSGSMLPSIAPGAILEIEIAPADYRIGDVVVFLESGQHLTAHRVLLQLKLGPLRWILQKGDNNALGHWIRASRVRGRVTRILPPENGNHANDSAPPEAYRPDAAYVSRRKHLRNLILKWPRHIRSLLSASK